MDRKLMEQLGKEAAELVRKTTLRSGTVPCSTQDGRAEALARLSQELPPASQHLPTRYGRKPPKREPPRD